jgi:hypothetical protein
MSPPAPVALVKEGKLRMFDESTARWLEATLKLYSNAYLEWDVDRYVGKQSSMPLQVKKAGRMLVKPGLTAKPIAHADYIGVFAIQPPVSYKRSREWDSLVLAAADPNVRIFGEISPFSITGNKSMTHPNISSTFLS